jgi:sigma-E factor negative regulatory protein RseB
MQQILFRLITCVCLSLSALGVQAQVGEDDIEKLLITTQAAAKKLSYSGVFVYQQGNQIRTSKIIHVNEADVEIERLENLDGKPREYVRRNREVTTYFPDQKLIQIEKNLVHEEFPASLNQASKSLADYYVISKAEVRRVAGIECQVLNLKPKDAMRYAYRICIDKKSGLLLGIQTINTRSEVLEQVAFTQLTIGEVDRASLKPSSSNTSNWRVENITLSGQVNSGWQVKNLPAGFKKTLETKRLIPISGAAASDTGNRASHQMIQMMFSDGLCTISVFIEPYIASRVEGSLQQGALQVMQRRKGDYWITVVGEMPANAVEQVISSLQLSTR